MARAVSSSLQELTPDRALLLAAHYAAESNIPALRSLAAARPDLFDRSLLFAILLHLLPETLEPERYVDFINDIARGQLSELDDGSVVDASHVQELSASKARSRAKPLRTVLDVDDRLDSVEDYIIARAHRIEEQTGLLSLIPSLTQPFVQQYPNLQTWYISNVLPLLRYQFEYYPEAGQSYTLSQIELADDDTAADLWLSKSLSKAGNAHGELARDLRGLVGPWIYGATVRKRRRLDTEPSSVRTRSIESQITSTDGAQETQDVVSSWRSMFQRLVSKAHSDLPSVASAVEAWNGPEDVDTGNVDAVHFRDEIRSQLHEEYIQMALACIYASEATSNANILASWRIVQAVNDTQDVEYKLGLDQQLDDLPSFDSRDTPEIEEVPSLLLEHGSLLNATNPLTKAGKESQHLAKFHVLSARLSTMFGHPLSTTGAFKIKTYLDKEEQATLFQKITHTLATGRSRSDHEWHAVQHKLLWLYDWGSTANIDTANGIFGKVDRKAIEKSILEMLVHAGCNYVVVDLYLRESAASTLTSKEVEQVIASTALQFYDSASNGNRTRGSMKKAFATVTSFEKYFTDSPTFARLKALIAATHAISSYSLTLQHGVPFTPVSIRVSSDPLSLIEKILAQNPGSYARAQDLMSIASNFVAAGLTEQTTHYADEATETAVSSSEVENKKKRAQRRVIGMAIEAALQEDDFETAYSYVVNWLDTSSAAVDVQAGHMSHDEDDDIAWRAALAAGKHKSTSSSAILNAPSAVRRLEQRMDLLSQALLLAPGHALPEILTAWRKCEEEMSSLLAAEAAEDDDAAQEQGIPGSFVDGGPLVQARREVGRGAAEEAPMGLFDVARGAAAAFSKSAFPLRSSGVRGAGAQHDVSARRLRGIKVDDAGGDSGSDDVEHDRIRKRDQLASAVTGGLASGIGWVLGANPVPPRE